MALQGLGGDRSPIQDSINGHGRFGWKRSVSASGSEPCHQWVHQVDASGIPAVNLGLDDLSLEGTVGEEPIGGGQQSGDRDS